MQGLQHTDTLTCHYCGYTIPNLKKCPECGSKYIKYFGTGTQKIEAELNRLFPEAKVIRMDHDTTSKKGGHEAVLNEFKEGGADILLGTQMVTKGLDFPDVTLVGVLAADSSLGVDDFRANERSFSLITQVCGRAGRGDKPGIAIIQTYQPGNLTINFAKDHNYIDFYQNEIQKSVYISAVQRYYLHNDAGEGRKRNARQDREYKRVHKKGVEGG